MVGSAVVHLLIPTSDHLQAGRPWPLTPGPSSAPAPPSQHVASSPRGRQGVGAPKKALEHLVAESWPPLTEIPQERKAERKEEPERKGPGLHVIAHRWEPRPQPTTDPAGSELQSERKAPIKHGLGRDVGTEIRSLEAHLRKLALGRIYYLIPLSGKHPEPAPRSVRQLGSSGVPATGR